MVYKPKQKNPEDAKSEKTAEVTQPNPEPVKHEKQAKSEAGAPQSEKPSKKKEKKEKAPRELESAKSAKTIQPAKVGLPAGEMDDLQKLLIQKEKEIGLLNKHGDKLESKIASLEKENAQLTE